MSDGSIQSSGASQEDMKSIWTLYRTEFVRTVKVDIVIFCHVTLGFRYHAMLAQARVIENLASSPFPLPFFMMFSLQDTVCDPEVNEHPESKIYSFVKFLFTVFNGFLTSKAIQRFCIT